MWQRIACLAKKQIDPDRHMTSHCDIMPPIPFPSRSHTSPHRARSFPSNITATPLQHLTAPPLAPPNIFSWPVHHGSPRRFPSHGTLTQAMARRPEDSGAGLLSGGWKIIPCDGGRGGAPPLLQLYLLRMLSSFPLRLLPQDASRWNSSSASSGKILIGSLGARWNSHAINL